MKQQQLEELLKKKGIGPMGSKSLNREETGLLKTLFQAREVSLTTKATMLTALLTLQPNPDEENLIRGLKDTPDLFLPSELRAFLFPPADKSFIQLITRVISGQNLSTGEANQAMDYFFDSAVPEYLKASFLEAERLKRETFEENQVFFSRIWDASLRMQTDIPVLIHLCDSFDGSNRTRNYSVFVAALLAAAGFHCLLTGIDSVAPKFGYTSHTILQLAGKTPFIRIGKALDELKKNGWTYLDQKEFSPLLYAMKQMRKEMVKRPFLATFEKLVLPIYSTGQNYIMTGYTHPHYKEELIKQLKASGRCDKAIVVKGMEGSTHMAMHRQTVCITLDGDTIKENVVSPADYGLHSTEEKQDKNIAPEISLQEGLEAFEGKDNDARLNIIYQAALILEKTGLANREEVTERLQLLIDDGSAMKAFKNKT